MGRPRIFDMQDSKKLSLNISPDNQDAIDQETRNMTMKSGPFINLLIKTFCRMSPKMRKAYINFSILQCKEINRLMKVSGELEKRELENEKKRYLEIAQILNGGIPVEFKDEDTTMQRIKIKNGFLIVPKDWHILNPEDAENCVYAGVVECRNSAKYGIPHFCYFTNTPSCDYDSSFTNHIKELCCKSWPAFTNVLEKVVTLIPNPEEPGTYLNEEEYLASPVVGFFQLPGTDDPDFNSDPPCGAMIERNTSDDHS